MTFTGLSYTEALNNPDYEEIVKRWSMEHLGYIILPSNMWASLIDRIKDGEFTVEDLETWIEQNQEEIQKALASEAKEKNEVRQLEQGLYGEPETKSPRESTAGKVSEILAGGDFSEEQVAIIVEAMLEDLPDQYLLFFMKKEYSPETMRKLKDYCTKLYRDSMKEVSGK